MNFTSLIFAVLSENQNQEVSGRTVFQKQVYFVAEKLGLSTDFESHYYGPFSRLLSGSVSELVASGFLQEARWDWEGGIRYSYSLTPDGRKNLGILKASEPEHFSAASEVIQVLEESRCAQDPDILSAAAKVNYILHQTSRPMSATKIETAAQNLGWQQLNKTKINKVSNVLLHLKLAKKSKD